MADIPYYEDAQQVLIVNNTNGNQMAIDSSGSPTVNQGAPNTIANKWPVQITDGTNTGAVQSNGGQSVVPIPVGTEGNAWSAASVSSGGNSAVIDLQYCRNVTIMGNVSNNVNPLRIQGSMDNTNFYTITTISAASGNFGTSIYWGVRYLRLQSGQGGAAVTITATVGGK